MGEDRLASPPEAPEIERKVRLHTMQWVGVPLVLLLPPVLALFGVFGESWQTRRAESAMLSVTVEWPSRFRYKQLNDIRVEVENRSTATLDTVTVELDRAYGNAFSTVRALPSFEAPYRLTLTDIRPGQVALAVIELQAERYGRHEARLTIAAGETITIPIHTTIFP